MKTIFEGVINGEKFDSVEAYNAKMKELMADPRNTIDAQTSTRLVADENKQPEIEKPVEQPGTKLANALAMESTLDATPGFNDDDDYYLDLLLKGDGRDDVRLEAATQECLDTLRALKEAVGSTDSDTLQDLAGDYKEILDILNEDESENSEVLAKLNQSLQILKNAPAVIEMYRKYYSQFLDVVNKELLERPVSAADQPKPDSEKPSDSNRNDIRSYSEAFGSLIRILNFLNRR